MSDRFGAKNIFRLAIVVFVLGSVACAFANSIHAFVLARFVQGVGGSMMTPVGRLLLVRATPENELVSAMAWLTIPALIGPIVGPPLGGFLTTYLSWHWVFWINVPIGVLGLALVTRFLDAGEPHEPRPIDLPGFVLTGVAFSGLVFGMSVISLPALPDRLRLRHLRARDRLRPPLPPARAARGLSAARPADAALSVVPRRDHRRLALPRRHRGHPVPSAADAAARLRAEPVPVRARDLRGGGRRVVVEVRRRSASSAASASATCWPSARSSRRGSSRSTPSSRPATPELVIMAFLLVGRRAALDLLHRRQRHGLLRYRRRPT